MIPAAHQQIIDEIMAGGRVMPPLEERIRQRNAHLAAIHPQVVSLPQKPTSELTFDASDYYASKTPGKNFTGD